MNSNVLLYFAVVGAVAGTVSLTIEIVRWFRNR